MRHSFSLEVKIMTKMMFSVRDSKAETWSFPFQSDNNATAIRDFSTLVNDGRTMVGQHPEDFDLYYLGTFSLSVTDQLSRGHY